VGALSFYLLCTSVPWSGFADRIIRTFVLITRIGSPTFIIASPTATIASLTAITASPTFRIGSPTARIASLTFRIGSPTARIAFLTFRMASHANRIEFLTSQLVSGIFTKDSPTSTIESLLAKIQFLVANLFIRFCKSVRYCSNSSFVYSNWIVSNIETGMS
jgi:hypothetical protein